MVIKGIDSGIGIERAFPANPARMGKSSQPTENFGKVLGEMVSKVNDMQVNADQSIDRLASGETKGLHEVMLAVEKASISFQFMNQVRNKAVEAYQEIMRMQV